MSTFEKIASGIQQWDGEDLNDLMPLLYQAEELKAAGEDDFHEHVAIALADVACRDDAPWPHPWDKEACPFAIVCDRHGRYLSNEVPFHEGRYMVVQWQDGVTCGDLSAT